MRRSPGLPEDFRLALVAVDVLGLSYREAARALHVREATITTRLFRGRKLIAKRLAPEPAPAAKTDENGRHREERRASGVLQSRGTQ